MLFCCSYSNESILGEKQVQDASAVQCVTYIISLVSSLGFLISRVYVKPRSIIIPGNLYVLRYGKAHQATMVGEPAFTLSCVPSPRTFLPISGLPSLLHSMVVLKNSS